ncbi:IE-1 [Alphabaculovirus myunipunctae]|uniref:IE-1 n=1 Tax=Mythimna unipuncta nucleopolyhedrovirus TaxID=447897 RepID=A0A2K9VSG8_9ABAC|nr:IE-1 [Mythimna unipuncta nucleopolyhedrovirus]AUV65408.1 IE-1 [Mythimna unipuncta nucleopolyhedrovirus]
MHSQFQAYQQCEGNRTPQRADIQRYLENFAPINSAPAGMYTDDEYNTLMNNAQAINNGFDVDVGIFDDIYSSTTPVSQLNTPQAMSPSPTPTQQPLTPPKSPPSLPPPPPPVDMSMKIKPSKKPKKPKTVPPTKKPKTVPPTKKPKLAPTKKLAASVIVPTVSVVNLQPPPPPPPSQHHQLLSMTPTSLAVSTIMPSPNQTPLLSPTPSTSPTPMPTPSTSPMSMPTPSTTPISMMRPTPAPTPTSMIPMPTTPMPTTPMPTTPMPMLAPTKNKPMVGLGVARKNMMHPRKRKYVEREDENEDDAAEEDEDKSESESSDSEESEDEKPDKTNSIVAAVAAAAARARNNVNCNNVNRNNVGVVCDGYLDEDEEDDDDDDYDINKDVGVDEEEEDDEDRIKRVIKKMPRGRYKKMTVSSVVRAVHVTEPTPVDPATYDFFNSITANEADDDQPIFNNRLFASHMLDTGYYMFIVVKPSGPSKLPYTVRYVSCVHSVYNEYTAHHIHHDRFVLVVTYERYRFLISYHLLLELEIDIPQQDQFSERKLNNTQRNQCFFEEVKDFEFLTLLTNYFHLDKVFAQGKISLLLASIGEQKARVVHSALTEMIDNKTLFTMPFYMFKKEASEEMAKCDSSMYVDDIVRLTRGLKFCTMTDFKTKKMSRAHVVEKVVESLSFWLRPKDVRSSDVKEKTYFTYKFGSVVRLLYNQKDKGVNKLFKIKKENGTVQLIENYLNACKEEESADNFILITTKSDERITIIKMGIEFIWITSVMKDIIVSDIIKKYRMYNHHIFNMSSVNRKEINNRHNGLIKLMAFYTGKCLTMEEIKRVAINNFECNYDLKLHYSKSSS